MGDAQAFLLSVAMSFLAVVGGGWLLTGQLPPPIDDVRLSTDGDLIGSTRRPGDAVTVIVAPARPSSSVALPGVPADQHEWQFHIYTGAPLGERAGDDPRSAWTRTVRDDG